MIDTSNLENCTWKVLDDNGVANGTAFFVDGSYLLTSLHVVEDFLDKTFHIQNREKTKLAVNVKDHCTINDLAILVTEEYVSENIATLCSEEPLLTAEWSAFGFPATDEGLKVGSKLTGTIFNIINIEHKHDLILATPGITLISNYKGFSGSGVINTKEEITSILRYKDTNNLCSVSIKKAENFLIRNNINVKADELDDFTNYLPDAFQYVSDPFKGLGVANAKVVAKNTSPQKITSLLTGKLMVPERAGTMKEIIGYLKSQTVLNKELWRTWLEFLSYVQLLKGEYSDINAVYISLPKTEVSKFVPEVETIIKQDINLTLQFFFTEEKAYFSIARQHLLDKSAAGELQHNHCHVFHSHNPMFGLQPFTNEEKKKIVFDIASPTDAGVNVAGSIDYGVLSFSELTSKVAGSQSILEATNNLIKIFTDAIS
ncbi:trypsin-like peptidase domain-containing protein [Pedobacter sp. N36a]|uniref:S1 family peptidase n=1 Tax=Pedobacter sp. N36a TaxID=2767996 RepID=UPI001656CD1F|nr:serine protease [Pedobacter sp. N36a]MBC8988432.1 trypsin-like peptidase domain-containing protein [Pedobacter sp. N36a]